MTDKNIWINPLGGLGDALMLSGVLKLSLECFPEKRYNLIRRTKYLSILEGHPAISLVGFPPKDAKILGTDYWARPEYGKERAFQVLAGIFGLPLPVEECLFMPGIPDEDPLFGDIPFGTKNILIAPASDSPRKEMASGYWEELTERLVADGFFILQVGKQRNRHIRNTWSLLGLTTPRQLAAIAKRCNLVITSDNFIMHVAHLQNVPAVVIWGPTNASVYGYAGQSCLRATPDCPEQAECIGPNNSNNYANLCHFGPVEHCMNRIGVDVVYQAVVERYQREKVERME